MPCYFTSHCKIDTQPSTTPKLEMKYILDNAIFNVDISRNPLVVIHNTTTFNKKPQLSTLQNNKSNKWEKKIHFWKLHWTSKHYIRANARHRRINFSIGISGIKKHVGLSYWPTSTHHWIGKDIRVMLTTHISYSTYNVISI